MFWQYVNGGSLEELLANRSRDLEWSVRIRLACDVAKGLKYLHVRGVMHRDLTSKVCHHRATLLMVVLFHTIMDVTAER